MCRSGLWGTALWCNSLRGTLATAEARSIDKWYFCIWPRQPAKRCCVYNVNFGPGLTDLRNLTFQKIEKIRNNAVWEQLVSHQLHSLQVLESRCNLAQVSSAKVIQRPILTSRLLYTPISQNGRRWQCTIPLNP